MAVIVLFGAEPSLRERIGAFSLPYAVSDAESPTFSWQADSLALVPYPDLSLDSRRVPKPVPFLGFGDAAHMMEAFRAGAADYLRLPLAEEEFRVRVARVIDSFDANLRFCGIGLQDQLLEGPRGKAALSREEAALLKILVRDAGKRISRVAIRRLLWPTAKENSRVVDETVSRLRYRIRTVAASDTEIHIHSIHGFGYSLLLPQSL